MSALEQIRKRPALIITILGAALVLFIISAVTEIPSLIAGNRDTVAKVDGKKIKYQELSDQAQKIRQRYQQQGMSNIDESYIQQMALEQLIQQALLDKAVEKHGITVTDEEMQELLFGENALPYVVQQAQTYSFETPEQMYQFAHSNDPGAEDIRAIWNNMENDLRQQLKYQKYQSMLGAINVNKVDAQAYYDDNATTSHVAMVRKDFLTIPDDDFKVSDDEIRQRYKTYKNHFPLTSEQRLVDYILIRPVASAEDIATAQAQVEQVLTDLKATPGTEAVSSNYDFLTDEYVGTVDNIRDITLKNNIEKIRQDTVALLSATGTSYTIAKLLDTYSAPDSVNLDIALINISKASNDSILGLLNQGKTPESLGELIFGAQEKTSLPIVKNEFTNFIDQMRNAPAGQYFIPAENEALFQALTGQQPNGDVEVAIRVNRVNAPVEIVEIAKISRTVEPSHMTIRQYEEQLSEYIAKNNTTELFKTNGAKVENAFDVQTVTIDPSMLSVLNLPGTGVAAKWAMENKKGKVSEIFTDQGNTYLLALAVEDIYDGKYLPVNNPDVTNAIAAQLRAEKKGEKLVNDYAGKAKDIDGYAKVMGAEPQEADITFGQDRYDAAILANVAAAKKGQLVGPFATDNSVVVLQVISTDKQGREFDFDNDAMMFRNQNIGRLQQNMQNIIKGNKKVEYLLQRFQSAQ